MWAYESVVLFRILKSWEPMRFTFHRYLNRIRTVTIPGIIQRLTADWERTKTFRICAVNSMNRESGWCWTVFSTM